MVYVVDTHSLIWYFEGGEKLGTDALEIMRDETKKLVVPSIVLAEIKYLFAKKRIGLSLTNIFGMIEGNRRCVIYPLDVSIVELMPLGLEMHDAMICATAILYRDVLAEGAKIITCDGEIRESGLVEIVW